MSGEAVGKPIVITNRETGVANQLEMGSHLRNRRAIRSAKNPLDKCTIISIFPKEIDETKFTIEPGRFKLSPGTYEDPSILVVGGSSWWKDYDPEQPILEIPTGSMQVAESVIKDYCNGMLGCNMGDAMPGLFFVLGEHTKMEIKMKYKNMLDEVKARQDNWYTILVRLADSLWARTSGNPLVIWDVMRLAARSLNLNDKPWLKDFQIAQQVRCFACGTLKSPEYPVCPSCRAVDMTNPAAKDLKFAQ